jgi:hypothetical protein
LLAAAIVLSNPVFAAEYVYRDVMGNTLPSQKCADRAKASESASEAYTLHKFTKTFCEVQGYGWHVAEEKNAGKLVCNECTGASNDGKYQCHLEDVVVACKRLKPGSVGLIPGEGG